MLMRTTCVRRWIGSIVISVSTAAAVYGQPAPQTPWTPPSSYAAASTQPSTASPYQPAAASPYQPAAARPYQPGTASPYQPAATNPSGATTANPYQPGPAPLPAVPNGAAALPTGPAISPSPMENRDGDSVAWPEAPVAGTAGAIDPYAIQQVAHASTLANASKDDPALEDLSLDALHEELKKRDAGVKDSSLYGKGMMFVFDDEGKKYLRLLAWGQAWTKFTENNPGTVDDYDSLLDDSEDIGIRRARIVTYSQLTERYLILMHLGMNNQSFTNGGATGSGGIGPAGAGKKPQIFFHEVYNEYAIIPKSEDRDFNLYTGAGLHYWNGISRKSNSSTLSYMTIDSPIFCWPNIEFTDEFARQLGWYWKGKWHKLDYRAAIDQPFNADGRAELNHERAVNVPANGWAYAGYFDWEFWDQEPDQLPCKTSTWLGEKKVFNIGAGYYFFPNGSGILNDLNQIEKQDQMALGFDVYYDRPVGDCGAAVTVYGVYYIYDYGDNYFRNVGILNTGRLGPPAVLAANGIEPTISGPGNAQPLMGTGEIFYIEGGYLLPKWVIGDHGRLQPFAAFAHKNLEYLDDPAFNYDIGCNYLLDGHRAKITLQYSLRPQFYQRDIGGEVQRVSGGHAGELLLQAQVAL